MSETRQSASDRLPDDASAAAAARGRELLGWSTATLLAYAAGAALLVLEPRSWSAAMWTGAVAFLLLVLTAAWWQLASRRGVQAQAQRLIAEYAVLQHVDPGPGRREPADRTARNFVRGRLLGWLLVGMVVATPLVSGAWDQPATAVPGGVLLLVAAVLHLLVREREARAGRRWLADPPGPPRD
ncbi:hypothetical protein DQ237_18475 [Blastococcus sp. TF02-8]|uniref:hypothetical protein n=1 Tax=Blastococcus sp. TF02-8 TaxID=2250574 RepID=UPI000DE89AFC|nr:hypothetical protein [Blastococcus sp. TF02-8]RBY93428.1 hypothetical protein DQ237_18475 [Blastococcus sp. TF02-8]